jgi:peptidyl-prolyl cis-trans isomerase SurA
MALGLLIGLSTLFSNAAATASAAAEVLDRIVAVVNQDIILLSELNARMAPYAQRIREQGFDLDREQIMLIARRDDQPSGG